MTDFRALSLHVGHEVAHPGVLSSSDDDEDERRYVSYYQWVGFTLFFQVSINQTKNGSFLVDSFDLKVPCRVLTLAKCLTLLAPLFKSLFSITMALL